MEKTLFKKLATLILVILSSNSMADDLQNQIDNIVLTDETKSSLMKQEKIIGCDNSLKIDELKCSKERTPEDRDKDIDTIKLQLSSILQQLAELKKEKDSRAKDTKFATIQKSISKLTIPKVVIPKDNNKTQSYSKPKEIKVLETKKDFVIVEVQSGESLSKYAQKYYGDSRKYYKIYRANQDKIAKNLQIYIGDKLIVPTSNSYKYKEIKSKPSTDIVEKKIIKKETKSNSVNIKKMDENKSKKELDTDGFIPLQENISWVETKVPTGVDIYDLAKKYYGDKKEYYQIYNINKNIIGKDLKLREGSSIKIPITEKFKEKPEYLGIR